MALKFLWNGIKDSSGKLHRASYSDSQLVNHPAGTITIYGCDYERFSTEIGTHFTVQNDTDSMTDYFEQDRIRVLPSHPLYAEVSAALQAMRAHRDRLVAKRRAA